jgi:hypothetical protein
VTIYNLFPVFYLFEQDGFPGAQQMFYVPSHAYETQKVTPPLPPIPANAAAHVANANHPNMETAIENNPFMKAIDVVLQEVSESVVWTEDRWLKDQVLEPIVGNRPLFNQRCMYIM